MCNCKRGAAIILRGKYRESCSPHHLSKYFLLSPRICHNDYLCPFSAGVGPEEIEAFQLYFIRPRPPTRCPARGVAPRGAATPPDSSGSMQIGR